MTASSSAGSTGFATWRLETGQERVATVYGAGVGRQRGRRDEPAAARRQQTHPTDQRQAVLSGHGDVAQQDVGLQLRTSSNASRAEAAVVTTIPFC